MKYKLHDDAYINDTLLKKGDIVEYSGQVSKFGTEGNRHMEPCDDDGNPLTEEGAAPKPMPVGKSKGRADATE